MKKVEQRRERIYNYILNRIGEGVSPSVREICADLNISSTSTVHSDLHHLIDMGYITMESGRNRTIRLPGSKSVRVALVGTVTAGQPILAVENIEEYIPVALAGRSADELFALRVRGDSMQDAAILDGDIVVVEKTPEARNGEIVVAMVEDEATVKRFYKEKRGYRLQPENEKYAPILLQHVDVLGRVLSVMRFY